MKANLDCVASFFNTDFQSTLKLEPGNMEANMHSARLEVHKLTPAY